VLGALPLLPQGRGAEVEALIGDLGDWPNGPAASVLEAHAAQFSLFARAHARSVAGRWDDSLRDRYAALQQARVTGDDGAIAHALADLASAQADLFNADDALTLATEAEQRGEAAGRTAAWLQAAFNRLAALRAEHCEEAAEAAERLLPHVDDLRGATARVSPDPAGTCAPARGAMRRRPSSCWTAACRCAGRHARRVDAGPDRAVAATGSRASAPGRA
jgi:hypothetical protein